MDIRENAMSRVRIFLFWVLLVLASCSSPADTPGAMNVTPATPETVGIPDLSGVPLPSEINLVEGEITAIQIQMIVFSGRVNPTWSLTEPEQALFYAALPQTPPLPPRLIADQLGYTGFQITIQTHTEKIHMRVYDGVIIYNDPTLVTFYQDSDRALERVLVETSQAHIDRALYQTIRDTVLAK